jgi:hypothetical protein
MCHIMTYSTERQGSGVCVVRAGHESEDSVPKWGRTPERTEKDVILATGRGTSKAEVGWPFHMPG